MVAASMEALGRTASTNWRIATAAAISGKFVPVAPWIAALIGLCVLGLAGAAWQADVVYLVGAGLLFGLVTALVRREYRKVILGLTFTALVLRASGVILLNSGLAGGVGTAIAAGLPRGLPGFGLAPFPDELVYESVAAGISEWWRGGIGAFPRTLATVVPYIYLTGQGVAFGITSGDADMLLIPHVHLDALVYLVLGRDPTALRLVHAIIASALPALVFGLTATWFGSRAGILAATLAAFEPTLVFWSIWVLKESVVVVLLASTLLAVDRFVRQPRLSTGLIVCVLLWMLVIERRPVGLVVAWLLPLSCVALGRARGLVVPLVALSVVAIGVPWAAGEGPLGSSRVTPNFLQQLETVREDSARGARTSFVNPLTADAQPAAHADPAASVAVSLPAVDDAVRRPLSYLPIGLGYVLGAPFFWWPLESIDRALLFFIPSLYALWTLVAIGAWRSCRGGSRRWVFPLAVLLALVLYLSLTEGSVGNLVRRRTVVLPLALPFAGVGLLVVLHDLREVGRRALPRALGVRVKPS